MFQRADVPALPADDPALHVVARQLDERNGRFRSVARGDALERVRDEVPRAPLRLGARLFVELPDAAGEVVADQLLRALKEVGLRVGLRHARNPLQLAVLKLLRLLQLLVQLLRGDLAVVHALLAAPELRQLAVEVLLERRDPLLRAGDLDAPCPDLFLDLRPERELALARFDLRLTPDRLRLALGVPDELRAPAPQRPQPALLEHHDRDNCSDRPHDDPDGYSGDDEQAALLVRLDSVFRVAAGRTRHLAARASPNRRRREQRRLAATRASAPPSRVCQLVRSGLSVSWFSNVGGCSVSEIRKKPGCRENVG